MADRLRGGTTIGGRLAFHYGNLTKEVIENLGITSGDTENATNAINAENAITAETAETAGTAGTADKLTTSRTIDITGDITATAVAFDGSQNIAISAAVNNNSHTHDESTISKSADSALLGGLSSGSFLRSNANDNLTSAIVVPTANRDEGMFGSYDSNKTQHIWSMGTAYRNHAAGTNFGTLYGLAYKHTNNTTSGNMAGGHQMVWVQNGTGTAAMGTGVWTSGNVTAYSDIRVKDNLEVIPNAMDKILTLSGYTYTRTDIQDKEKRFTGVVAQELLEVLPEAVEGDDKGLYSVAYGNIVGLLIEGIKEQQLQIEELKAIIKG